MASLDQFRPSGRAAFLLSTSMLLVALCALVLFGFVGMGRGGSQYANDARYLYMAGEAWEQHRTPYESEVFKTLMRDGAGIEAGSYAYPPTSAPLAMALSYSSLGHADLLISLLNLISIFFMIFYTVKADFPAYGGNLVSWDSKDRDIYVLIALAFIVGNPFIAHAAWLGQTTLLSAAFILMSWMLAHRRHDIPAGILLALGAFKPQLAVLIGFWFLLDRRWLLLLTAAGATVVISAWPIATTGIGGSWLAWVSALSEYQSDTYNATGFRHVFGIRSLFDAMGIQIPSLLALAVLAVALLYFCRKYYEEIWLPGPIFTISILLIYSHDYDLAAAMIMALPLLVASRGYPAARAALLILVAILFFPQRIWEHVGMGELSRSREIALMGILAIYLVICRRAPQTQHVGGRALRQE